MKTRTSICKENVINRRKLKKCDRKSRPQPTQRAEVKKQRPPLQQNRFTNILELSTLSASLMQLHDLFGTLILDFSQDPVQMKISDVTGNYELNVSKESLSEFKMKVLLGQDSKGKPAFTIFLGECQCYPELPEGALETKQNDDTVSQIDSIGDDCANEANISEDSEELDRSTIAATEESKDIENGVQKLESLDSEEMIAPLFALFEDNKPPEADDEKPKKNTATYVTHHISIAETQKLEPLTNSDELIVKMRPKRVIRKLRKIRPEKSSSSTPVQRTKKRSVYRNNLEGFVKFLMTDSVCGCLLDKMTTPGNIAERKSEPKMVKYSDGQEYRVFFSKDTQQKDKDKPKGSAQTDRPSNSREINHDHTKSTDNDGIEVLFERPKPFEKSVFVEQVKKEIEEWQARGEQTVNVEIVEDAKSSSSEDSSNVVTVYEDLKTSKKLDTEFDDATSNSCTDTLVVESTEKFFLDVKEEEEEDQSETVEENNVVTAEKCDLFAGMKTGQICKKETETYVTPIPLETTTTADIEAMWMSFVEMFHHSSESAKKLSSFCPKTVNSTTSSSTDTKQLQKEDTNRKITDSTYPGQHSLPYFVEESLKRVNSMLDMWHAPLPNVIKRPQNTISPPQMSNKNRCEDSSPGRTYFCDSKHYDVPTGPPFHKHPTPPGKFSTKKSRIFFNPHVSIGDWH